MLWPLLSIRYTLSVWMSGTGRSSSRHSNGMPLYMYRWMHLICIAIHTNHLRGSILWPFFSFREHEFCFVCVRWASLKLHSKNSSNCHVRTAVWMCVCLCLYKCECRYTCVCVCVFTYMTRQTISNEIRRSCLQNDSPFSRLSAHRCFASTSLGYSFSMIFETFPSICGLFDNEMFKRMPTLYSNNTSFIERARKRQSVRMNPEEYQLKLGAWSWHLVHVHLMYVQSSALLKQICVPYKWLTHLMCNGRIFNAFYLRNKYRPKSLTFQAEKNETLLDRVLRVEGMWRVLVYMCVCEA